MVVLCVKEEHDTLPCETFRGVNVRKRTREPSTYSCCRGKTRALPWPVFLAAFLLANTPRSLLLLKPRPAANPAPCCHQTFQETLAVGAYHSSALAETTWDFETGDLVGWRQTGDAFALQPTYGDNPYFRAGGSSSSRATGDWSRPSKSRLKGR